MKISARNQFEGEIKSITPGSVFAIVEIEVAKDITLAAGISINAVRDLELVDGRKATAVIKASNVLVGLEDGGLRLSARNQFAGKVVKIVAGAVNAIVSIEIAPGIVVTSTITLNALKELDLVEGQEAIAIIKASDVMVGVR